MRILILGGDGMLGHALLRAWRSRHEVFVTLRQDASAYRDLGLFTDDRTIVGVDARNLQDVVGAIAQARPSVVVNGIGIVKQRSDASECIPSIEVNALFPHRLALVCRATGARLIHLSTDCVFSGARGRYREEDPTDALDLYGTTKALGEVRAPHCVTLRTSIIGLELARRTSLVEWFLAQRDEIRGFSRAIYTGLTTAEISRAIEHVLISAPELSGVWHLASAPISKLELLTGLASRLGRRDLKIVPDEEFRCDRSLDGSALAQRIGYRVPSWAQMLDELAEEIFERRGSCSSSLRSR